MSGVLNMNLVIPKLSLWDNEATMECRLLNFEEFSPINSFYNNYYRKNRTLDQWRWEFVSPARSFGLPLPFAVICDGEKVAGTQALIPIRMIDQDGVFWSAKSEETLVDPAYRGQNLFSLLYEPLFDYARRNNILAIWGFTPARRAFEKLGFSVPVKTGQLFLPFSFRFLPMAMENPRAWPLGLLALAGSQGLSFLGGIRNFFQITGSQEEIKILTAAEPPEEAGILCERFIKTWGGVTIYRDADYLAWRFYENPYLRPICLKAIQADRLVGFLAFCMTPDRMGYLVDILAVPGREGCSTAEIYRLTRSVISKMVSEAVRRLGAMGALGVRAWSVTEHPFARIVRRELQGHGFWFFPRGHDMIFKVISGLPERPGLSNTHEWYITRVFSEGSTG